MDVSGSVRVSDPTYARDLALAGLGLAYVLGPLIACNLAEGRLVELVSDAAIVEPGLFLYYSRRAANDAKLRAFVETAKGMRSRSPNVRSPIERG